ncbi:Peptidase M48, membrane-bound metallopeptidase [Saccharolobus shibatae]|uniref:Peptidase M48, membrane-bound metallopeptidase n=2 Tax=Saccharolobus shibatae TaxID=2286 RepID=A0A8F5BS53_9CREN|nr:Peptidase M48, membrane-bound metallopeptidase [Saccharolobus shibatae]QXJ30443.1 Peptidase M48, membrane-bound metallopeptidase [Saccharolobus shibatae]
MDWELSLFNVSIVVIFYEGFHGLLYYKSKEVRKDGKVSVRVLDINEENAIALNSFFFRNTIVFLSDEVSEKILRHEEGHLKQFNYIYAFLLIVAALLPLNYLISIPSVIVGKIIFWEIERDADLYAYTKYNVKYESDVFRPKSRIERLKEWLLDSHPPDWVRKEEEYYDKKTNILKLFICDLFS